MFQTIWLRPIYWSGLTIIFMGVALAFLCPVVWCDSSQGTVDLAIDEAPLGRIVMMLTKQAGIDVIMAATPEESQRKVSAHVTNKPVEQALKDILMAAGVSYRQTDSGAYLIGALVGTPVEKDSVQAVVKLAETPIIEPVKPVRKTRTEKIMLKHWCASDVVKMLLEDMPYEESITSVKTRDPQKNAYNPGAITPNNGVMIQEQRTPPPTQDEGTYPVPPTQDLHSYTDRTLNEAQRSTGAFNEAEQYPSYRQTGSTSPSAVRPGGGTTRPTAPGTTPTTAPTGQTGLRPDGIDYITALDVDNSILVRGDDEAIFQLKEVIRMLDLPPKQVEIKAEFIEVSANLVNRLGIDWSFDNLNTSFNTGFVPAGNVVIGAASGNVTAVLRTELTSGKGKIVNSPIISTINNMEASIQIGQDIPLFLTSLVSTGTGSVVSGTQVSSKSVNTGLTVLPRINADDSVTMRILPTVSDTGKVYKGPDGTEVPATTYQFLQTSRRVMNEETIVVGGFIRRSENSNKQEVPILGRLPLIGGLFRTRDRDTEDRELLIFLTPKIIRDTGGASTGVRPEL